MEGCRAMRYQCCLIDGERVLESLEVRLAHARDGRENAELSRPQTARPQDVVVQLCYGSARDAQRPADTGDSRSGPGPFVGPVPRPFMASCYSPCRRAPV